MSSKINAAILDLAEFGFAYLPTLELAEAVTKVCPVPATYEIRHNAGEFGLETLYRVEAV